MAASLADVMVILMAAWMDRKRVVSTAAVRVPLMAAWSVDSRADSLVDWSDVMRAEWLAALSARQWVGRSVEMLVA